MLQRTPRFRSLCHVLDFRETLQELCLGFAYIIYRWRGIETDRNARRLSAKEEIFEGQGIGMKPMQKSKGKWHSESGSEKNREHSSIIGFHGGENREIHIKSERWWSDTESDHMYGIEFARREQSAALSEQTEIESESSRSWYRSNPQCQYAQVMSSEDSHPLQRKPAQASRLSTYMESGPSVHAHKKKVNRRDPLLETSAIFTAVQETSAPNDKLFCHRP